MKTRVFLMIALLCTMVQGAWADELTTDESGAYLIKDVADWTTFCNNVNNGINSYKDKTVKLTANISGVTTMAGTEEHPFAGTFDGDGFELNVNITSSSAFAAPFGRVGNATFLDLYVRGSVTTTMNDGADHTAGLIGKAAGIVTIYNVRVSVDVTGLTYYGGFIGHGGGSSNLSSKIVMGGCVFDGKLKENTPGATEHAGGFIGWGDYMTIDMTDCMFDGAVYIGDGGAGHHNFHPIGYYTATGTTSATLGNVYYRDEIPGQNPVNNGTAISNDGKLRRIIQLGSDVTSIEFIGGNTDYPVANITSYDKGMKFDTDLYAANGEVVNLALNHTPAAAGQSFASYTVSGGGSLTAQNEFSATLSMSDNNQIISAKYDDNPKSHLFFADNTETGWSTTPSGSASVEKTVTVSYSGEHKVKRVTVKPYRMAAEVTAEDKGKLICAYGHIHAYGKDSPCDAPRYAKIIYVGSETDDATYTHGLALALTDVINRFLTWDNSGKNNDGKTASQWCDEWNTTKPVPDARWMLPTQAQFNTMIGANGANGYTALRDAFSSVGGTDMMKYYYYTNTENANNNREAWVYDFNFWSNGWSTQSKNETYRVRPVLVFGGSSITVTQTVDVTMTGTKTGDTYNYSGEFSMPAYDVEVSTGLYYKLSQTANNNAATYGTKKDVYLEHTLQADGWNTFCAPFDISPIPTGWTVKKLSSSSFNSTTKVLTLNFADETTKIAAGTPYLVKVEDTVTDPTFENITQAYTANPTVTTFATFMPVLTQEYMEGSKTKLIVTDGNKLTNPTSSGYMNAFRAYFQLKDDAPVDANDYVMNFDTDIPKTYSWEGDGSEANPYMIKSPEQLNDMQEAMNGTGGEAMQDKYFRQGANITFDKAITNNYIPVKTFKAHYDGAGFVISGLNIALKSSSGVALFGAVDGNATIKNVIVNNSTFKGSSAGAIAGSVLGNASIENCHVLKDVTINSTTHAGGIVGAVNGKDAKVTGCTSQATVEGVLGVGGIAGIFTTGQVGNSIVLSSSITGSGNVNAVVGYRLSGTVENCYFTAPTLSDENAKLMPMEGQDNTGFLDLLHKRDEFLLKDNSGLTKEDISYDLTMNGRTFAATKQADGTWKSKAFTVCLPFEVRIEEELQEDVKVYKLLEVDLDKKLFTFTNEFPILVAGNPYVIVVEKGTLNLSAKNVTIVPTPKEPYAIKNPDGSKQIGWWRGTFKKLSNDELIDEKAYIIQPDGMFKRVIKKYSNVYVAPFRAYFSALEELPALDYQMKFIQTENGEETGDMTEFPADDFDFDFDLDEETGIGQIVNAKSSDGKWFDLQGRQLSGKPNKGIYIQNGKKIIIK